MKRILIVIGIIVCVIAVVAMVLLLFFPIKYKSEIELYAEKYSLPQSLVASVINIESGYDKDAESRVGARGIMQVLPSTAVDCAIRLGFDFHEEDLWKIDTNMEIGCFYLSYLLDIFDGNIVNALCAYNWGLGNVKDHIDKGNVDSNGTITKIPVEETDNYIKKYYLNEFVYSKLYKYS